MASQDTKHLRNRGGIWYFQKAIPNQSPYCVSLKTDSLREAQRLRAVHLAKLESTILAPESAQLRPLVEKFKEDIADLSASGHDDNYTSLRDMLLEGEKHNPVVDNPLFYKAMNIAEDGIKNDPRMAYTVGELKTLTVERAKATKGDTTWKLANRSFDRLIEFLGDSEYKANNIARTQVVSFIEHLSYVKNLKMSTIGNNLSSLGVAYSRAVDRGLISSEANPFRGHKVEDYAAPEEDEDSNVPFSVNDFGVVQGVINDLPNIRVIQKWVAPLLICSGMRFSELAGLHKEDVRLVDGIWCFDIKPNSSRDLKNKSSKRVVPISDSILPAIMSFKAAADKRLDDSPCFFEGVHCGGRIGSHITKWFSKVKIKHLEGSNSTMHGLRKNYTTALEKVGVSESKAAQVVGHKKATMTYGLYSGGFDIEALREAGDKSSEVLKGYIENFPKELPYQ